MTESTNDVSSGPVLVGYDGTDGGADALALAVACARVLDAALVVVAVYPGPAPIGVGRVDAEWVAAGRAAAERVLERARLILSDGGGPPAGTTFTAVGSSSAAHGLHDLAEQEHAELIVVGPPREPQQRLFAGGTAHRLLTGAACPVGVAPSGLRHRQLGRLRVFAVAHLDTPEARSALAAAVRLARRTGVSLRLYTVIPEPAEVMPLFLGMDAELAFTDVARETFQRAIDEAIAALPPEIHATGEVLTGDVVDVLANLDDGVDALFCGSRGYGPVRRVLLGGVSAHLIGRARAPVVVVPRGADQAVDSPDRSGERV
jgi:nucleotide-binding universal stress UspA family protein